MPKTKYRRWQVILGVIGFLLIMGVVGKIDQESQQAVLEERVNIRDQVKAQYWADYRTTVTRYDRLGRGVRP